MTTSYPAALDSFTNPTAGDNLSTSVGSRTHSAMHADVNDAVEVIESVVTALGTKKPCRAATTANITISTALNNGDTLDGITLATGDRVLVKDQSTGAENGIYVVGVSPARADDMAAVAGSITSGTLIEVSEGTLNAASVWQLTTTGTITPGTTALTFARQGSIHAHPLTSLTVSSQALSGLPGGHVTVAGTGYAFAANQMVYTPMVVRKPITISLAEARVTTASGGAQTARLAIYKASNAWMPTDLVSDLGTISTQTTGRKTIGSLSVTLPIGLYLNRVHVEAICTIEAHQCVTPEWSNHPLALNHPLVAMSKTGVTYAAAESDGTDPDTDICTANGHYSFVTYIWTTP